MCPFRIILLSIDLLMTLNTYITTCYSDASVYSGVTGTSHQTTLASNCVGRNTQHASHSTQQAAINSHCTARSTEHVSRSTHHSAPHTHSTQHSSNPVSRQACTQSATRC